MRQKKKINIMKNYINIWMEVKSHVWGRGHEPVQLLRGDQCTAAEPFYNQFRPARQEERNGSDAGIHNRLQGDRRSS